MIRINHRRYSAGYGINFGTNYQQTLALQTFSAMRGPNNGVNLWDFQHVDPGRNRVPFMRYTRWPNVDGNGQAGWYFNPSQVLPVPFTTLASGVVSLKFRIRVMQPLGNGPHSGGQKWFIWGGPGIPNGESRMIFVLKNGLHAGGTLADHTTLEMGAGVSGNRCTCLIPNGRWVNVQIVWKHGLAGQSPFMRMYVDNNNEAAPDAEHTTFLSDGMAGNWPAPPEWNTGFWGNIDSNAAMTDTAAVFDFQGAILQQGFDNTWNKQERPVTTIGEGRWGISRILEPEPRKYVTAAQQQNIGTCHAYYPPHNSAGGYDLAFAIVHFPNGPTAVPDANTRLLPDRLTNTPLGDLTAAQRTAIRNNLEEWLISHSYTDAEDVPITKAAFSAAGFTAANTLADVLRAVFSHIGCTEYRPRFAEFESHNTEYLDDFSVDPATTGWVSVSGGAYVYDGTNDEMDCTTSVARCALYYPTGPGSIEHESQATFLLNGRAALDEVGGGIGRIHGTNDDFYFPVGINQTGYLGIYRHVAGSLTILTTFSGYSTTRDEFITLRSAYSGTAGSNVVINLWYSNHSTSKPSDPGWIGVDGSPNQTYTDSSVDRLDDSTHEYCGIGWAGTGSDYDTRHCFFKERAISDRGGGGTVYTRTLSDTTAISDAPLRGVNAYRQTPQDSAALIDSMLRGKMHGRVTSEALVLNDSAQRAVAAFRLMHDGVAASDDMLRFALLFRRMVDSFALTDALAVTLTLGGVTVVSRILQDNLNVEDAVLRAVRFYRREADAVNLIDSAWHSQLVVRRVIDLLSVSEAAARALLRTRVVTDTVEASDLAFRYALMQRLLHDNAEANDSLASQIAYYTQLIGFVLQSLRVVPVVVGLTRAEPILMEMHNI